MRSRITHKIYRSFALVLISIKMSNTRIIDSKIELPFNRLAIWLMREQIVTEPIWRPSHPSRVRGLKWIYPWTVVRLLLRRTLHGCVDWNWSSVRVSLYFDTVAPFTGAWIEILRKEVAAVDEKHVAPFTGAWIEIWKMRLMMDSSFSRTWC